MDILSFAIGFVVGAFSLFMVLFVIGLMQAASAADRRMGR